MKEHVRQFLMCNFYLFFFPLSAIAFGLGILSPIVFSHFSLPTGYLGVEISTLLQYNTLIYIGALIFSVAFISNFGTDKVSISSNKEEWTSFLILFSFFALASLVNFFFVDSFDHPAFSAYNGFEQYVYIALMLLIMVPTEEIIFRGVIQTNLQEYVSITSAIFLSSVSFSLIHIPAIGFNVLYLIGLVFTGTVFGIIYYRAGNNILAPITVHAFNNILVLIKADQLFVG